MPSLNSVHIIGNCTRDPELRYTPTGVAVCDLGLAINRNYVTDDGQKKTDTTFVDVTLWAKTAELVSKYVKKGSPIFVDGRLQMDSWEDKQTHQQRTRLKIIGESVQLLASRPQTQEQASEPTPSPALQEQRARNAAAAPAFKPTPTPVAPAPAPNSTDIDPDDIPF
jgi:single-strand DNA-binding protein